MGDLDEEFDALLARSSLGTEGAGRLRDRTPLDTARAVRRIADLRYLIASPAAGRDERREAVRELRALLKDLGHDARGLVPTTVPPSSAHEDAAPRPDSPDDQTVRASTEAAADGTGAVTLWHVFLTVAGPPLPTADVRRTLERFAAAHPFALTARYAADHAEVRYWEEAHDLRDAAATALRLWQGHGASTELTGWIVTGLEIIDRATYHQRTASGAALHRPEAGGYGKEPAVSGTGQDMLRERRGRRPGS